MHFVVDESTGTAVVEYLRNTGHDVLAIEEAMPQADDEDIIVRMVKATLEQHATRLAGSFTVVTEGMVRIRRAGKPD